MKKSALKMTVMATLFLGSVFPVIADFSIGATGSRNGTTHTGYIYCPSNETIRYFELGFDTSSATYASKPYDMYINGTKVYSATTSQIVPSGNSGFATVTPPTTITVPCVGRVSWFASSTSASNLRITYQNLSQNITTAYSFNPSIIPVGLDRYVSVNISGSENYVPSNKTLFLTPDFYYVATTVTASGSATVAGTTTVQFVNETLYLFYMLFFIMVGVVGLVHYLFRPFLYARE